MVVSERGDILSPKYAPLIIAPSVCAGGIPRPAPIPIRAMPIVPMVPHEVPVARDTMEQINSVATRKNFCEMTISLCSYFSMDTSTTVVVEVSIEKLCLWRKINFLT